MSRNFTRKSGLWSGVAAIALLAIGLLIWWTATRVREITSSYRLYTIPSASMEPTLTQGSVQLGNESAYETASPKAGEIVIFNAPVIALPTNKGSAVFIMRCVGVAGDVIEIRSNRLYRNGEPQDEPYVAAQANMDFKMVKHEGVLIPVLIEGELVNEHIPNMPFKLSSEVEMQSVQKLPPAPIPPNFILVMGDNREGAFDGRYWGLLPVRAVFGRVESADPPKGPRL